MKAIHSAEYIINSIASKIIEAGDTFEKAQVIYQKICKQLVDNMLKDYSERKENFLLEYKNYYNSLEHNSFFLDCKNLATFIDTCHQDLICDFDEYLRSQCLDDLIEDYDCPLSGSMSDVYHESIIISLQNK